MKVIMLNGSPRVNGCTYTALREVADTLKKEGIESEIIHIKKDSPVTEIREKIEAADGLVIGSPVYFSSPTGILIDFLDRLFWHSEKFALKPGASLVSARRAGTTASLDVINKYLLIAEMPIVASQYWCAIHGNSPDEVRQDEEGMQIMRTLGRNLAYVIKSFKAAGLALPAHEPDITTSFIR